MNPFKVQKIITECKKKDERLIIEELSRRCDVRLRHAHVRMSKELFEAESCGGFPRHWVKRVSFFGWITLWFYKPPKETDFSFIPEGEELKSFGEMKKLREVISQKSEDSKTEEV